MMPQTGLSNPSWVQAMLDYQTLRVKNAPRKFSLHGFIFAARTSIHQNTCQPSGLSSRGGDDDIRMSVAAVVLVAVVTVYVAVYICVWQCVEMCVSVAVEVAVVV